MADIVYTIRPTEDSLGLSSIQGQSYRESQTKKHTGDFFEFASRRPKLQSYSRKDTDHKYRHFRVRVTASRFSWCTYFDPMKDILGMLRV